MLQICEICDHKDLCPDEGLPPAKSRQIVKHATKERHPVDLHTSGAGEANIPRPLTLELFIDFALFIDPSGPSGNSSRQMKKIPIPRFGEYFRGLFASHAASAIQ